MKQFLWITAFIAAVSGIEDDEWNRYKAEYNKVYTSEAENVRRLQQYLKTKQKVEEHNRRYERGETSYTMAINQFADRFSEESRKFHTSKLDKFDRPGGKVFQLPPGTPVPDSINWVEKGAVTSVKDQGECGGNVAFSAAGALEALMFRTNNTITDLSAQQLIDCSPDASCRNSGFVIRCYIYVEMNQGIYTDKSYPYKGQKEKCRTPKGTIGTTAHGYATIRKEEDLRKAVGTLGPVSTIIWVGDYMDSYSGGIYDGDCDFRGPLTVLVVGYGTDEKTKEDYWLVKNSWGTKWGEKGYARLKRGKNLCNLALHASFPV